MVAFAALSAAVPAPASASSVVSPSVALTSTAAGSTGVTYLVDFTTAGTVSGGTLTVAAPSGTVFSSSEGLVRDETTGLTLGYTGAPTFQNGSATATWPFSGTIPAGHRIELEATDVTNPGTGTGQLLISTSADTTPAGTSSFSFPAAQSVSSPSVSPSTTVASATGASYAVGFTTSSTGGLAGNYGTISVALPTGSVIPNQSVTITDARSGQYISSGYSPTFQNGSATATWSVSPGIPTNRAITLDITNVTNAGGSGGTVQLWTSSDTQHNTSAAVALGSAQPVSSASVSPSTAVASAPGATYQVGLTTSSTGALAASYGTVSVALPTGSVIPNESITITDATTGQYLAGGYSPTFQNASATATWIVGTTIPANRAIILEIPNVTNATGTGGTVQLWTSSDTARNTSATVALTTAKQVGSPTVSPSTTAAGASGVTYLVGITTSSTGALMGSYGTVSVALPTGSVIPAQSVTITDATTGQYLAAAYSPTFQNGSATATWTVNSPIPANRAIVLDITNVTNPGGSGGILELWTSSDSARNGAATVGLTTPKQVGTPDVTPTSGAAAATGTTYVVNLTTSSTGALAAQYGTITVSLPAGTVIPTQSITITDATTGQYLSGTSGANLTNSGATATWIVSSAIAANRRIRLEIANVTNSSGVGGTVQLSTSSDTAPNTSASLSLAAAQQVGSPTVSPSTPAAGATGATYLIGMTTTATGALAPTYGTISVALPTGSVISSNSITITDAGTGAYLATAYNPTFQNGKATATWTLNSAIPASRAILLDITNVTNATGAGGTVQLWTSSDTTRNTSATVSLTAAQQVGSPNVTPSTTVGGAAGVTYQVGLTTSSTGALAAQYGTITVGLPTGSVIPNEGISIIDATTGQYLAGGYSPTFQNASATATWTVNTTIPAGRQIEFQIPSVASASGSGGSVQLSTSSDTVPNSASSVGLVGAQPVGSPTLTISNQAASATGVAYTVDFTTSSTGGLAASHGTITVALGNGTVIPASGLQITDVNTGETLSSTSSPTFQNGSATATWTVYSAIPAGRRVRLTITGVHNPAAASYQGAVSTSSDTAGSTPTYQIGPSAPPPSIGPSVLLSSGSALASHVNYTLIFTNSAALSSGTGTITVTAPSGTALPSSATMYDLTANQGLGNANNGGANASAQTYNVPNNIPASDVIEIQISGVTNPSSTAQSDTIKIATSAGENVTTNPYSIVGAGPVGSSSVALSSSAAGATGVSYGVQFTTSANGGLVGGQGTISITAPTGTVIPNQGLSLYDLTANQTLSSYGASLDSNTGTWTVASDVPANHTILATITGITNPTAVGTGLQVSTSSDPAPASAAGYSLGQAQSVSSPSLTLSSPTAGATGVTYAMRFTTSSSGGLADYHGTITLSAASGTVIPNRGLSLFDLSTGQSLGGTYGPNNSGGNSATWPLATGIPAGDTILATLQGVTNPVASSDQLQLSTSSDISPATIPYSVVGGGSVGSPAMTLSSSTAGAAAVSYGVQFTTSANGALVAGEGAISITAPTGTVIPSQSIGLFDLTADQNLSAYYAGQGGNTASWTVASDIPANHTILATITGITNPTAAGSGLQVSTSSDPVAASATGYSLSQAQTVSGASLALSSSAAGAHDVTYSAQFTTSSGGGLVSGQGTITLSAASGTVIPNRGLSLFDLSTGQSLGGTYGPNTSGGNSATWPLASNIPAGHTILATLQGVTNPVAGSDQLQLSTSSDISPATIPYSIVGAGSVGSPSVSLSSSTPGATAVSYGVQFTTSANGALVAGQGTISITAPTGTVIPSQSISLFDLTDNQNISTYGASLGGNTATWTVAYDIPANHTILATITGITNPASAGSGLQVSTSSDPVAASAAGYSLGQAQSVANPSLTLSSPTAGASGVTYAMRFTTSSSGGLADYHGTITLSAASGTVIPNRALSLFDLSTGQNLGGTYGPNNSGGSSATWQVTTGIPAGDTIVATLQGVTNPGAGSDQLQLSTSSDTSNATIPYSIVGAASVGSPSVVLSSSAAGATGVSYGVQFTTSSNGALVAGQGTISITAPSGTVIPNQGLSLFDLTTDQNLSTYGASLGGNTGTWTVAYDIPANHTILATITGVTNPAAGNYQLQVATSSDRASVPTPFFTIGSPQSVSAPTVALSNYGVSATNVTYKLGFKTSATGGLAAHSGTITAYAPTGTVFAGSGVDLFDDTTSIDLGPTSSPTLSNGGATATWTVGATAVPAGDHITLTATGVANPVGGTYQLDLATSSDTSIGQTASYRIATGPSVSGVSPSSGPLSGGNTVTISGSNLTGATGVSFGANPASNVAVVNDATITATAPAGTVGSVHVTVTTPQGTSASTSADQYTYVAPPTVTAVSPNSGPTAGGMSVTITGTNLSNATAVKFGTSAASGVTVVSATQITATAPAESAGAVDVTVTTAGGTSATGTADQYTYLAAPTVSAVSPSSGPTAGGTSVTITGTGFVSGATVAFGGNPATNVAVVSGTKITATAPAGSSGAVDVTVTTSGGTSPTSSADQYTYLAAPTVSAVSPSSGPTTGNTSVTITGTGFVSGATVMFGNTAATHVTVVSPTKITASSPAGKAGTVDVTVTTPGGTSATGPADQYTYVAPPTVSGVSPSSGPAAGGTPVTITGTGFISGATVAFGTTTATNVSVVSGTKITATVPAGSPGVVDVTVTTTGGGTSATGAADQYTYLGAPTVTAISPASGPTAGGTPVTITGTGFISGATVAFGTIAAGNVTVVSGTKITATAPATDSAGTVDVTVTTSGGTSAATSADQYTYAAPPTATITSPADNQTYNQGQTVSTAFSCADGAGGPGINTCTDSNGAAAGTGALDTSTAGGHTYTVTATSQDGQTGTATIHYTVIGPPTATIASPADNQSYNQGQTVSTRFSCTEASGGPGISACADSNGATGGTGTLDTSSTGAHTYTVTATSQDRQSGTATIHYTVAAPPTASISAPADNQTYNRGQTVSTKFACAEGAGGPGLQACVDSNGASGNAGTLDTSTAGAHTYTVTATSQDGDTGNATIHYAVVGPPTATITSPANNQTYNQGQSVSTQFSCTDASGGPGISTCADSNGATGGAGTLDTSTAGAHTYTVTATSQDGQTGTATIDYTVASPPPAPSPVVSGGAPTSQTGSAANPSGSVNPEGAPTQAYFEYGLDLSERGPGASTTLYDQATPVQQVGSDTTAHTVAATLTGLLPGALYHVRLVAINASGTTFGSDQTFTTAAAPPPPAPVVAQSQDIKPVSGTVFIRTPSGQFIPVTGASQIPNGTVLDALHGSLQLTTAVGQGKTEHGIFGGAIFKLTQAHNGLTTLSLVEGAFQGAPSYATCKAHKSADASIASSKTLQLLHASAHGKFRTSGRYSAATVRGTVWTVADRCDGTLTHVITDSVAVTDFVRRKTIIVHAGQSYLAKAHK